MMALSLGAFPQPAFARAPLVVDDDGRATATDCSASQRTYATLQAAVNASAAGDTILVCPGVYNEQVVVTTSNLTILGSGMQNTFLRPSAVQVNSVGSFDQFPMAPILLVSDASGVTIKNLTLDGSLAGGGAAVWLPCLSVGYYTGLFFRHSLGVVDGVHITHIRSASACSAGFSGGSDFGSAANLVIQNSTFDDYGSVGLNCVGPNTICSILGNTFSGSGPVDNQLQAGIILRLGTAGAISGNTISGHFYAPKGGGIGYKSVGIALFNAEPDVNPHIFQENTFSNNQLDVQRQSTAAAFQ